MLLMMGMDYKAKVSIALKFPFLFLAGGSLALIYKVSQRRNPQTGKKTNVKLDLILLTLPCLSSVFFIGVYIVVNTVCVLRISSLKS